MWTKRTWSRFSALNIPKLRNASKLRYAELKKLSLAMLLGCLCLSIALGCTTRASAHTPESPEVQAIVGRGVEFLRTAVLKGVPPVNYQLGAGNNGTDPHNTSWGAEMLAAMVCWKVTGREDDPVVEKALARTRAVLSSNGLNFSAEGSYECSIGIIFLAEFGEKYKEEISKILTFLLNNQQNCGAWMYSAPGKDGAGDTSVTQYAILAMWAAKTLAKVDVPTAAIVKACTWLVRTQHISGQFSYLPAMPGSSGRATNGTLFRSSMTIAGVGSMYVSADLLKMNLAKSKGLESEEGLPKAFRLVNPPSVAGAAFDDSLRSLQKEVEQGIIDGEKVLSGQFPFTDSQYLFYTFYSYERLQSLKYYVTKRKEPKEPGWYDQFVSLAKESQNPDGSWVKNGGRVADTAFMCLTLLRGMKKTLKVASTEGTLIGGRGLPGDTSSAAIKRGKIVSKEQVNSKEDIMKVLDSPDAAFLDDILEESTGSLLDSTPENRAAQLAKIRTTLIDGDFNARRNAIKVLARDDNLDNGPLLIFALSDPDIEVVRGAEAGLRRISRRLASVEIPENATKEDRQKRIDTWKTWYKNLRPNAIFLK